MPVSTKPAKSQDGTKQPPSRGFTADPNAFEIYARKAKELGLSDQASKAENMARQLRRFTPKAHSSHPAPKANRNA